MIALALIGYDLAALGHNFAFEQYNGHWQRRPEFAEWFWDGQPQAHASVLKGEGTATAKKKGCTTACGPRRATTLRAEGIARVVRAARSGPGDRT